MYVDRIIQGAVYTQRARMYHMHRFTKPTRNSQSQQLLTGPKRIEIDTPNKRSRRVEACCFIPYSANAIARETHPQNGF